MKLLLGFSDNTEVDYHLTIDTQTTPNLQKILVFDPNPKLMPIKNLNKVCNAYCYQRFDFVTVPKLNDVMLGLVESGTNKRSQY